VQLRNLAPNGGLKVNPHGGPGCSDDNAELVNCGPAPEPKDITEWLNTPDGKPVSLAQLRGKVVLVDFWTYSCINCQRTLPHLESWYTAYKNSGLEIIGVHSPEFAFERVPANVREQAKALNVQYPIALDNNFATWREYNATWPSEFLIDKNGNIRHVLLGEGHYDTTESLIRQLLTDAKPGVTLPAATNVPDQTPTTSSTHETYLSFQHTPLHSSGPAPQAPGSVTYHYPANVEPDTFALSGTWDAAPQSITAGPGAELQVNYQAKKVHLVAGGRGTLTVRRNGQPVISLPVNAGAPTLYTLVDQPDVQRATITVTPTPGISVYSFTFD
jgi:thiol-disulfide isomerase/thioredoxin